MKQFGPTSCSAKRSDLFLPKVRYVRKKRSSQHLQQKSCEKNEGAFGKKRRCVWKKNAGSFEGKCVRVHTLVRSCSYLDAFACVSSRNKRIGVRTAFIQVFAWTVIFFFSKKIYGSRMESKIGSRFGVQKGGPRFVNTLFRVALSP